MKLKALLTDDDAVSPVIGVILMVAITVILAAVIGTFVLGLGNQVGNNAPQASMTFDWNDGGNGYSGTGDTVTITHNGGATVSVARLSISAGGSSISDIGAWSGDNSDVTAGESITVAETGGTGNFNSDVLAAGNTVQVVWQPEGGGSSAIIGSSEVPA